jgi:hypothetical protein
MFKNYSMWCFIISCIELPDFHNKKKENEPEKYEYTAEIEPILKKRKTDSSIIASIAEGMLNNILRIFSNVSQNTMPKDPASSPELQSCVNESIKNEENSNKNTSKAVSSQHQTKRTHLEMLRSQVILIFNITNKLFYVKHVILYIFVGI